MHGILIDGNKKGNDIVIVISDIKLNDIRYMLSVYFDLPEDEIKVNLTNRTWTHLEFIQHFKIVTIDYSQSSTYEIYLSDYNHVIMVHDMKPDIIKKAINDFHFGDHHKLHSFSIFSGSTTKYFIIPEVFDNGYWAIPVNVSAFGI